VQPAFRSNTILPALQKLCKNGITASIRANFLTVAHRTFVIKTLTSEKDY